MLSDNVTLGYYKQFLGEEVIIDLLTFLGSDDIPWKKLAHHSSYFLGPYNYSYGNICHISNNVWPTIIHSIVDTVNGFLGTKFNSVLINYYANGNEGVDYHADDESIISPGSSIASLSFCAERTFDLLHNTNNTGTSICLSHDSLLVMSDKCQTFYKHRLRIEPHIIDSRFNLTLRQICNGG